MASEKQQVVHLIPIKDIVVDQAWNARSGAYNVDSSEEDGAYKDLKESIKLRGLEQPIVVRPVKGKMHVVAGFRRLQACTEIAADAQIKDATIKCFVEELDELGARLRNISENSGRGKLRGADLSFALGDAKAKLQAANAYTTDDAMFASVGVNQSYGSKLVRIVQNTKAQVFKKWRDSVGNVQLTVPEMVEVSRAPKERQDEAYETAVRGKQPAGTKDKKLAAVNAACKQAHKIGKLLGKLEKQDLISTDNLDFPAHIAYVVKLKSDFTAKQTEKVAKAAQDGYEQGMKDQSEEPDAEGGDTEE